MKDNEIIKAVAELDGWKPGEMSCTEPGCKRDHAGYLKDGNFKFLHEFLYLTYRDAIVPVIEKQRQINQFFSLDFQRELLVSLFDEQIRKSKSEDILYVGSVHLQCMLEASPRQLCEALLHATGKWKD